MVEAIAGSRRRGGRAARHELRSAPIPAAEMPVWPGLEGGRYKPLSDAQVRRIHEAALEVLETVGLADAIPSCVVSQIELIARWFACRSSL